MTNKTAWVGLVQRMDGNRLLIMDLDGIQKEGKGKKKKEDFQKYTKLASVTDCYATC